MSTYKTKIAQDIVASLLSKRFPEGISNLEFIEGGEGSQAFSFTVGEKELIFRANKNDEGFEKDRYAYEHFRTAAVPIPKILEIGELDSMYYALSERVVGMKVDALSESEKESTLPKLLSALDAIHNSDIQATKGYGKWSSDGDAEHETWHAYLYSIRTWVYDEGKPPLFEKTILEEEVWNEVFAKICALMKYCPEERRLLHGDYGFDNVFSDGKEITGVIDWSDSSYGDPLYDGAWLSYWSKEHTYREVIKNHYVEKGALMKDFDMRMHCYELHVGLAALTFYAFSHQDEKYYWNKKRLLALLNKTTLAF